MVRADEPTDTYEIDAFPITGTFVVPQREIILFSDFTNVSAYGRDGKVWRSRRLALDDLRIDDVTENSIQLCGFFGGHGLETFTAALDTGQPSDPPLQF